MSTTDRDQAHLPMGLRERVMAASLLARGVGADGARRAGDLRG